MTNIKNSNDNVHKNTFHYETLVLYQLCNHEDDINKQQFFDNISVKLFDKSRPITTYTDSFSLDKFGFVNDKFLKNTNILELILLSFNNLIDNYEKNIKYDIEYVYNNLNFINIVMILFLTKNRLLNPEYYKDNTDYFIKIQSILKKSIQISIDSIDKNKYTKNSNKINFLEI